MSVRTAIAAAALVLCASPAPSNAQPAQTWADAQAFPGALSVNAQVSVVYLPEGLMQVAVMRTNYVDRVPGEEASTERVLSGLHQAALGGVARALAEGAHSGRVDVVAVVYQIGSGDQVGAVWAPVGTFMNTTQFERGFDGEADLVTRIRFIPDQGRLGSVQ
ncbi:MAG: hypothetical protein M0D54_00145 [Hyphomonadaceae bacterium JAD_PAG50586_4]|nr:MAG: hypothetical protein M0D54_00145 [Hyphomonadaceae bacterium JAD_PAG50586_4]